MTSFLITLFIGTLGFQGQTIGNKPIHPWYLANRVMDLNYDGKPDSLILQAIGNSSDSLSITLALVVNRRCVWLEPWASNYQLVDPPEFPNGSKDRDAYIREALDSTLASVSVEPFSMSEYTSMSEDLDSTIVHHPPKFQVSFSYGYETHVVLYWDSIAGIFRRLWACC